MDGRVAVEIMREVKVIRELSWEKENRMALQGLMFTSKPVNFAKVSYSKKCACRECIVTQIISETLLRRYK